MRIIKKHTVSLYGRPGDDGVWYTFCRECSKARGTIHICNEIISRFPQRVADASYKFTLEYIQNEETTPKALARSDSPSTSKAAAQSVEVTKREREVLETIVLSGKRGLTADELLIALPHLTYSGVTARPAALRRKGWIYRAGDKRKARSGQMQYILRDIKYLEEA